MYGFANLLVQHPRDFTTLLGHILRDYFYEEFKIAHSVRYIDTDFEGKLLPQSGRLGTYFSFIPFLVGSLGFLKWKFGNKIHGEVCLFIGDVKNLFSDAGFVFENAPTKLKYRQSPGLGLKLLHFLDRPRNCFPSLHVILASYSYLKTKELLDRYSPNRAENLFADRFLSNWSLRIIESCLQTKQHGIRDIAGGLAVVSSRCPQFSQGDIRQLINAMFSDPRSGFGEDVAGLIRAEIGSVYSELISGANSREGDYRSVLVDYVRSI